MMRTMHVVYAQYCSQYLPLAHSAPFPSLPLAAIYLPTFPSAHRSNIGLIVLVAIFDSLFPLSAAKPKKKEKKKKKKHLTNNRSTNFVNFNVSEYKKPLSISYDDPIYLFVICAFSGVLPDELPRRKGK